MELIPAIDIMDGKCVRLVQGDFFKQKVYADDPLEMALRFEQAGFKKLHVVDLDGAKAGKIINLETLHQLCKFTSLSIDFGGGIKREEDLQAAFQAGAAQVTVGTIAVKEPQMFTNWVNTFGPEKIVLGADVRHEKIAVCGWLETTEIDIYEFLREKVQLGVTQAICTDVLRDGLLSGPSFQLYKRIKAEVPEIEIIASGGITCLRDLEQLREIGCSAAIIGKALYEEKLTLKDLETFQLGEPKVSAEN